MCTIYNCTKKKGCKKYQWMNKQIIKIANVSSTVIFLTFPIVTKDWGGGYGHQEQPSTVPASPYCYSYAAPTRSRGIRRNSEPCFRKTFPAVWLGLMPMPSSVIMAEVAGGTLNSSAANLSTAVKGVFSGTLSLCFGEWLMAYRNGCGEDGREGYSLEGESPSMMTLGNAPSVQ